MKTSPSRLVDASSLLPPRNTGERGIVVIVVLVVLLMMAMLSVGFMVTVRNHVDVAEVMRRKALVDSAVFSGQSHAISVIHETYENDPITQLSVFANQVWDPMSGQIAHDTVSEPDYPTSAAKSHIYYTFAPRGGMGIVNGSLLTDPTFGWNPWSVDLDLWQPHLGTPVAELKDAMENASFLWGHLRNNRLEAARNDPNNPMDGVPPLYKGKGGGMQAFTYEKVDASMPEPDETRLSPDPTFNLRFVNSSGHGRWFDLAHYNNRGVEIDTPAKARYVLRYAVAIEDLSGRLPSNRPTYIDGAGERQYLVPAIMANPAGPFQPQLDRSGSPTDFWYYYKDRAGGGKEIYGPQAFCPKRGGLTANPNDPGPAIDGQLYNLSHGHLVYKYLQDMMFQKQTLPPHTGGANPDADLGMASGEGRQANILLARVGKQEDDVWTNEYAAGAPHKNPSQYGRTLGLDRDNRIFENWIATLNEDQEFPADPLHRFFHYGSFNLFEQYNWGHIIESLDSWEKDQQNERVAAADVFDYIYLQTPFGNAFQPDGQFENVANINDQCIWTINSNTAPSKVLETALTVMDFLDVFHFEVATAAGPPQVVTRRYYDDTWVRRWHLHWVREVPSGGEIVGGGQGHFKEFWPIQFQKADGNEWQAKLDEGWSAPGKQYEILYADDDSVLGPAEAFLTGKLGGIDASYEFGEWITFTLNPSTEEEGVIQDNDQAIIEKLEDAGYFLAYIPHSMRYAEQMGSLTLEESAFLELFPYDRYPSVYDSYPGYPDQFPTRPDWWDETDPEIPDLGGFVPAAERDVIGEWDYLTTEERIGFVAYFMAGQGEYGKKRADASDNRFYRSKGFRVLVQELRQKAHEYYRGANVGSEALVFPAGSDHRVKALVLGSHLIRVQPMKSRFYRVSVLGQYFDLLNDHVVDHKKVDFVYHIDAENMDASGNVPLSPTLSKNGLRDSYIMYYDVAPGN